MPSFERTFSLKVPSSTENLALIRDFVSNIGSQVGFDDNEVARIALAVDEACANVIEHAYGSDTTRVVTVRAVVDEDALRFEIVDNGLGFDPALVEPLQVEELIRQRRSGGLGLRLIRQIMDDVQYHIGPGGKNELLMVKKLKKT
ncbi:MAG: ATP-binding protein [Acidobacteria bacterium]|nr:ATP-binding protein [Acidobacteriota bacterium]